MAHVYYTCPFVPTELIAACGHRPCRPQPVSHTACAAADSARYEEVLKLNMIIPYGAIGLASIDDEICFAMVNTYLRETANPRELGFSIMTLAREGDTIEKALSRQEP